MQNELRRPEGWRVEGWRGGGWRRFLVTACEWFYLLHLLSGRPSTDAGIGRPRDSRPAFRSVLGRQTGEEGSVRLRLEPAVCFPPPVWLFSLSTCWREGGRSGAVFVFLSGFHRPTLRGPVDICPGKREQHGVRRLLQFCVQSGSDRGVGGWEEQPPLPLHQERVQPRQSHHHRRGVQHQDGPAQPVHRQSSDLGHSRPGALQGHHLSVLQGGGGGSAGVRHQQAPDLREHGAMAEGAVRARRPPHRGDAGGEQARPGEPADGSLRGGPGLCRSQRSHVHGDLSAGFHQR